MWHCPECGEEVDDAVPYCWMCGGVPDGAARPKMAWIVPQEYGFWYWLSDRPFWPPYRVSRRFSVGRLMGLTAFCVVLWAVLCILEAPPVDFFIAFGFVMIVGLAQVFAYSGHRPRRASIVAGGGVALLDVILGLALQAGTFALERGTVGFNLNPVSLLFAVLGGLFFTAESTITLGLFGYLAGWVVVGILLGRETASKAGRPDTSGSEAAAHPEPAAPWRGNAIDVFGRTHQLGRQRHNPDGTLRQPLAGVTRQFGMDRLLLMMVLFAVVFAVLRGYRAGPVVYAEVVAFMVVVGVAQAFLYGGKRPRRASVVAGAVVGAIGALCVVGPKALLPIIGGSGRSLIPGIASVAMRHLPTVIVAAAVGGLVGYVVGCVVAGVFLGRRHSPLQHADSAAGDRDPLAGPSTRPTGSGDAGSKR